MLIFDQLKKNDPQLRVITWGILTGMLVLLAGLWYVQVLSYRHYNENQRSQAYRTVRIPAIRGKILDRHGLPLAENQPSYNLMLYMDELREFFQAEWRRSKPKGKLTRAQRNALESECRYRVASNVVQKVSGIVQQPLMLTKEQFLKHYTNQLALPYPVLLNLTPQQVARFQEHPDSPPGVDLDVQPLRFYPHGKAAAHLLGFLTKDNSSAEGEDAYFNFRLPDYRGRVGIEWAFDGQLRGRAGMKSVLVNSLGYRQSQTIWTPAEAGKNVVLTIDLAIQQAAEKALQSAPVPEPPVRGAVVVMDPNNGNILAMASAPSFDPNSFIPGISREEYAKLADETLRPQLNRATQENYHPGSIFKIVTGLACLDAGLDPLKKIVVPKVMYVGRRPLHDPQSDGGEFDFQRAFVRSSNNYFATNAMVYGVDGIVRLGQEFHFGQKTHFEAGHEVGGRAPSLRSLRQWHVGETLNLSIGQGSIDVTPLQIASMIAAVANGGKVLRPRLIERIEPQETWVGETATFMPPAQLRGYLHVQSRSLETVRKAMLGDVEDPEGSGKAAFVPGMRVCGKTGTAQQGESRKAGFELITWFASYAPYENPRYVVVVMVESGPAGGRTCAPVAGRIYKAIHDLESSGARPRAALVAEAK
jgi:penicillin-binding protein 2